MSENVWQEVYMSIFRKNLELRKQHPSTEVLNEMFDHNGNFEQIKIGELHFPTGRIEIGDPFCYMNSKYSLTLEEFVAPGDYPVSLSVITHPVFGFKFLGAKVDISGKVPVRYDLAMPQGYTLEDMDKPGVFPMFGVDTGLACICDKSVSVAYDQFLKKWHEENPDKNHYDDYFAAIMADYAEHFPRFQRPTGDYLDWCLPETDHNNLIMCCSGFGDGVYNGYWGYDETGKKACLVIRFIDPEAYNVPMPELPKRKKFHLSAENIKPLIEGKQCGIATDRIMVDGCKVGYMLRNEPRADHPEDSGWMFYEGTEDKAYCDEVSHFDVYMLNTIANYDQDIIPFLESPVGNAYFRGEDGVFHLDAEIEH